MKKLRIYLDTSVFGGCLDEEFEKESCKLFDEIRAGRFMIIVSTTTMSELELAPEPVRVVLAGVPPGCAEFVEITDEMTQLRDGYLSAGVVGKASLRDAEHMACATVAGADMVVSWNFKHIVHYDKIAGYNAVNMTNGYGVMKIYSPREVVES